MAGLKDVVKLPSDIGDTIQNSALAAGGLLANRLIAPRVTGALNIQGNFPKLLIQGITAFGIGALSMNFLNKKQAAALTTGAVIELLITGLQTVAPSLDLTFQSLGANTGLTFTEPVTQQRIMPPTLNGANMNMGLQAIEVSPAIY